MEEEFTRHAATRDREYMGSNMTKKEIVRILHQQHAIPVYLIMKAWDQIEEEYPPFYQEYFVRTLLNPDGERMGTAENIGAHTGATSSSLHVPPPAGDAPVQALSSEQTAPNVPSTQVPSPAGDALLSSGAGTSQNIAQVPALIPVPQAISSVLRGTSQSVPRSTRAQAPSPTGLTQVPTEIANPPVQHPHSPKTEILMKILGTLVEMKTEIASKQEQMLKVMSEGQSSKRRRDEQEDQGQESPDSRRQRLN